METETPKPFLQLSGKTILARTLDQFSALEGLVQVVVATSQEYVEEVRNTLEDRFSDAVLHSCIAGGSERQDSIHNALNELAEVDLVIIHDAVRPFVEQVDIRDCCRAAADVGAAILGVPASDTIKRINDKQLIRQTPERKYLWQAQTPQVFRKDLIVKAYEKALSDQFSGTDDASLVERIGQQVKMVRGRHSNIKITYPLDLEIAKLLIGKNDSS